MDKLLEWDIYQISNENSPLKKIRFRGRIRKFCVHNKINVIVENAIDEDNTVRFAVLHQEDIQKIKEFIHKIIPESNIELIAKKIHNPVISKMKINNEERYIID